MKRFLGVLAGCLSISFSLYSQSTLSGRVLDEQSGEPLPGATISFTDLSRQAMSDSSGAFNIQGLPAGNFTVQVSFLGYRTLVQRVKLSGASRAEFQLRPSLLEIDGVVVTASPSATEDRSNSISVESVSRRELLNSPASNLVDAISRVPGVSQISSGPGISKPVIRGLSFNRVLTVHNGIRQEGQQWGDEHGLEFDLFAAGRAEVLRGPASLLYGSDALGGVLHILDPIPLPEGEIRGDVHSRYASNNGQSGTSVMLEGNQKGLVWRGRATYQNAHSYRTPNGFAPNTAFNERNFSGMLGLQKSWGYSHLNVSLYQGELGFLEHAHAHEEEHEHEELPGHEHEHEDPHDHAEEHDHGAESHAEEEDYQGTRRKLELPMQEVGHVKLSLNNNFIVGNSQLRANFGYQANRRKEFEHAWDHPDIAMDLDTWSGDLKFFPGEVKGFEPVLGLSGLLQRNVSRGEEHLIPDHRLAQGGLFAYLRKGWEKLSLNAGVRFDYRHIRGEGMTDTDGEEQFAAFSSDYSNFSGSIGVAYSLAEGLVFKANAGSAFRAPNISELASNGEHHGVERFEIGDQDLKAEQSLQFDASLSYTSRLFGFELNGFSNTIYNYIYLRGMAGDSILHEGEMLPAYRYSQADAHLRGLEAVVDLHPLQWLHLGSAFSYVKGHNKESGDPLPFIPAAGWRNELKIEPRLRSSLLRNSYLSLELASTFRQDRVDPAFELPSEAYHLVNVSIGGTLLIKGQPLELFVSAANLFDVAYMSHLNRYRYQDVLNPGRNVQLGLRIPLLLKKP